MPVRRVSNRGGNVIGHFPSIRMKRMVAFESLIERDYLYLLDYEPNVEWFEEQPLTVEYRHDGKVLHYTPDFHIVEAGRGDVLIECKPLAFVDKDENRRKFRAARFWCANRGWAFRIVTDQDVRAGFRLENVKLLTRYARHVVEPGTKGRIYALLHSAQSAMSVNDLVRRITCADFSAATAAILCMAFHHEIFIPLDDAPILGGTCVCLPSAQSEEVSS
jgi:hypothetical protein